MRSMNRFFVTLLTVSALFVMSGCCLKHEWTEATCDTPKMCTKCGKIEGEPLGHDWTEASCEAPKTCSRCGETEGEALGHDWVEADCENPKTCSRCNKKEGEALGHTWLENTPNYQQPKTCEICGGTEGEPLEAAWADYDDFAELDEYYDFNTQWSELFNTPGRKEEAKVRFTNYRVCESDEEFYAEKTEGYEYREIDVEFICNTANTHFTANLIDYYIDDEVLQGSVNWLGENYGYGGHWFSIQEDHDYHPEYADFGWMEDGNYTYEKFTFVCMVPKGYDGICLFVYDASENAEFYANYQGDALSLVEWAQRMENIFVFRMDQD